MEYKCRFCPATFSTPEALARHYNNHGSGKIQETHNTAMNLLSKRVTLPSLRVQKRIVGPENERQVGRGRGYAVSNLQHPFRFPSLHSHGEIPGALSAFTVLPTGLALPQPLRLDLKNLDPEFICRAPNCYPAVSGADTVRFQPQAQYLFTDDPWQFEQQLDRDMQHFPPVGSPDNSKAFPQHNLVNSSYGSLHNFRGRGQEMDQDSQSTLTFDDQQEGDHSHSLSFDELLELDWQEILEYLDDRSS